MVGSFEDAVLGVILNGSVQAVVIYDSIPFASVHNSPVLREVLTDHLGAAAIKKGTQDYGIALAQALKLLRPELDIYLLSDRAVEKTAGDPAAKCIRRVFYQVEEPLEIHLSILDGVLDRYSTPYFDNLQKYAQRPIGTFHALPVARGKSIFKSNWIRDMGAFYGINLFLAESSATSGGLDSLLEPTGQYQGRAGQGRARVRRGPRLLRDQRHFDLEQDGGTGAAEARRHRPGGPQLPQVAPLRRGPYGRAAALRRSVSPDQVLHVRRRARCATSRRPCSI